MLLLCNYKIIKVLDMKAVKRNLCVYLVLFVVANLLMACSNEQTAYLEEDTNMRDIQEVSVCETSLSNELCQTN